MSAEPSTAPETNNYLAVAKANWNAVPGFNGGPDHFMQAAQTCALISIAESLATLAGPQRVQPSVEDVAGVLDVHRWKTMGVASIECECGETLHGAGSLAQFPADQAFRQHIARAVQALYAAPPAVAEGYAAWYGRIGAIPAASEETQCTSDLTLRDEEHRMVRCVRVEGHDGDHTDGAGVTWTGGDR